MNVHVRTWGLALAMSLTASQALAAPVFTTWYAGKWSCTNDGRPALMVWRVERVPVVCVKAPCPDDYEVYAQGSFTEEGGEAERLQVASETSFDLKFTNSSGGPAWYLAYDLSRRIAIGHSFTDDGQRRPLVCRKLTGTGPIPIPRPDLPVEPTPLPHLEEM